MPPEGFEPAVLASERPKTNDVECAATGIYERPCPSVELLIDSTELFSEGAGSNNGHSEFSMRQVTVSSYQPV